jgi:hypothetical protein
VTIWNPSGYESAHPGDHCNAKGDAEDAAYGCVDVLTGVKQGPTSHGVGTVSPPKGLVGLDPSATWVVGDNPSTPEVEKGYVSGGCMASGTCKDSDNQSVAISPRIVPIAIFDTSSYFTEATVNNCNGTGCVARVVNLAGYFIEGMCSDVYPSAATRPAWCGSNSDAQKIVIGRFMKYPGQWAGTGGPTTSSFSQSVRLVR